MFTKGQVISFLIVLAVIVGGAWQALSRGEDLKMAKELTQPAWVAQEESPPEQYYEVSPQEAESAFIVINDGTRVPQEFMLEVSTSTTALDLLQEACLISGFSIESQEYEFGVLVEAINNKRNRQDEKYWLFYVNSALSQLTPDKVVVSPGDKIEFIFSLR